MASFSPRQSSPAASTEIIAGLRSAARATQARRQHRSRDPALEREAAARLPLDPAEIMAELDLVRLDTPAERPIADRLMFYPTLTINGFHGGYGGAGMKTVLPHEAFVKCDIRLVEAMTPDEILDKVEAHVAIHASDVTVVRGDGMLPSKTPMGSPFGETIRRAIVTAQGVEPLVYPSMGGSLPDYVFTKILGVPAFVVPYANADEANHAPNENLEINCFIKGIRTGAALLSQLSVEAKPVAH
jgi:acetylornithine deacetylase/succinyl-diaminopimelate desuccinylase-like protein